MNYLVDDIEAVVNRMKAVLAESEKVVYYMYGNPLEINNRLLEKNDNPEEKDKKYPLIALRLPFEEDKQNGIITYTGVNIAFLEYTEHKYTAKERYDNVIKPILAPLYELFFRELRNSGKFIVAKQMPQHTVVHRLHYGTLENLVPVSNIFSDPLDAIEIIDLELKQNIKC